MDTLGNLVDRREPLVADGLCEEALGRFIREPDTLALAVVDAGRPIGLVPRDAFMARMEAPGAGARPVRDLMDGAPVIAIDTRLAQDFIQSLLAENPQALLTGFIVTDEAGDYVGVGTAVNLMAGARRHGRRHQAAELIDRIAAEVRQPVRNTLAVVDELRRLRLPEGAGAYLDTISEASAGILTLLESASALHSAETGRFALAPEPRRLQELMDEVEGRWRRRAEDVGVTLLVSYDGDPDCAAMVDSPRLMQVFDALIGHALAHVRHGVVEASLKTRAGDDGVQLAGRVRDNGAIYAPEALKRLFDLTSGEDVGVDMAVRLGLAVAGRTVAAMGGKLSAEPNVGAGATIAFDAMLPLAGAEEQEAAPSLAEAGRAAHILVVDDNATNRMVVEALCEMFDCSTESVCDGVEAVEAAAAGRFDVILMDIKMPRMDGVTATREIRRLPAPHGATPIIALTANADPDEVAQYLEAGMCAVVEKPIKPERLLEALEGVLNDARDPAATEDAAAA